MNHWEIDSPQNLSIIKFIPPVQWWWWWGVVFKDFAPWSHSVIQPLLSSVSALAWTLDFPTIDELHLACSQSERNHGGSWKVLGAWSGSCVYHTHLYFTGQNSVL